MFKTFSRADLFTTELNSSQGSQDYFANQINLLSAEVCKAKDEALLALLQKDYAIFYQGNRVYFGKIADGFDAATLVFDRDEWMRDNIKF